MKQLVIILIIFFPLTIQAGICTDNYNIQQQEIDDYYELQIDECSSNPDCVDDVETSHLVSTAYNTLAWFGCCGSLGPLFC